MYIYIEYFCTHLAFSCQGIPVCESYKIRLLNFETYVTVE